MSPWILWSMNRHLYISHDWCRELYRLNCIPRISPRFHSKLRKGAYYYAKLTKPIDETSIEVPNVVLVRFTRSIYKYSNCVLGHHEDRRDEVTSATCQGGMWRMPRAPLEARMRSFQLQLNPKRKRPTGKIFLLSSVSDILPLNVPKCHSLVHWE